MARTIKLFKKELKIQKSIPRILMDHILAILLPYTGLLLTLTLLPVLFTSTPALIFIPLIALSTWNGGISAGILTSIVSAIALTYYIPMNSISHFLNPIRLAQLVLLIAEGTFISMLIGTRKRQDRIKEYKRMERDLNKRIVELVEQNSNYSKEIRSRDEFLSIASHELKTPLTSMLLQTQTALHNIRNVSVAHFSFDNLLKMLESVENQTKRLSKMINDLLAVSLITTSNLTLEYEEVDLDKLVQDILTDFSARLEKDNYKVKYDGEKNLIGNWDKIRMEQTVSNFISNAIKYGNHKEIEIRTRRQNNHAEFVIQDHGIGIPRNKQKNIFELFQRAVSPEKYKGLGVGLYITDKIIRAHGGSVEVSSSPDNGARFTMKLPLKKIKSNLPAVVNPK